MESTGIYWMPIYEILEDAFAGDITLLVVNAHHTKNVLCWILNEAPLLRTELLNGIFIPEKKTEDCAIWTITARASSMISHPTKTALRSFYKASVFVCPLLFVVFWRFGQEHHLAPNWARADKPGGLGLLPENKDKKPYRWNPHVRKWNPVRTSKSLPEDSYGPLWFLKRTSCRNRKESWGGHGPICFAGGAVKQHLWNQHNGFLRNHCWNRHWYEAVQNRGAYLFMGRPVLRQ